MEDRLKITDKLDYIVELMDELFFALAEASCFIDAEWRQEDMYSICITGANLSFTNPLWQKIHSCPSDEIIQAVLELFSKKRLPFFWWETVRKDLISYATKLIEYGFSQEGFYRGYVRSIGTDTLITASLVDIDIVQVHESEQMDYLQVFKEVFGVGRNISFKDRSILLQWLHFIA